MHVEMIHQAAQSVCAVQINFLPTISSLPGRDGFGECVWPVDRFGVRNDRQVWRRDDMSVVCLGAECVFRGCVGGFCQR